MRLLRRKKKGILLGVFSDTHTGSITGLRPPMVVSEDGGEHAFNPIQELMWNSFIDMTDRWRAAKDETGWPLVVIHNGDMIDGNHHGTHEIWTLDELAMAEAAKETVAPAFSLADVIYMMRGTPSHVGKLARFEEEISKDLARDGLPIRKPKYAHTWQHLNLLLNDVLFDVHHKAETGSFVPWTKGAEVNRISTWLGIEYAGNSDRIPDVALRSHYHSFSDSGLTHKTRTFITPPWQQTTSWAANVKWAGKLTAVGGLLFYIHPEGERPYGMPYDVLKMIYKAKRDEPEVIHAAEF
jgi:hypothetical protein